MVIFLKSPLKERIWGNDYFKKIGLTNSDEKIGELWSCSGHKEGSSIVDGGLYDGMSIIDLFNEHKELFNYMGYDEFPVLVKLIATSDRLSVQIHPNDEYAKKNEGQLGKTEGWLVLDKGFESSLVVGHNAKDKQELLDYISKDDYDHLLNYKNVEVGDFYPIYPGTIHAIGKDLLILEIQQSSDVTYRFFDYHRKDKNGNERQLHLDKAVEVTNYEKYNYTIHNIVKEDIKMLWDNNYFYINLFKVDGDGVIENNTDKAVIVSLADGNVEVQGRKLFVGESFILTRDQFKLNVKGKGILTITNVK